MKFSLFFLTFIIAPISCFSKDDPSVFQNKLTKAAALFIPNLGQVVDVNGNLHPEVSFTSKQQQISMYFGSKGVYYIFTKSTSDPDTNVTETYRFNMVLEGANTNCIISPEEELPLYTNYYHAHCPDGITFVKSYSRIVYHEVYPKIDLTYYYRNGNLKYDFIVHPGGNPSMIKMTYEYGQPISNNDGSYSINTPLGHMKEEAPVCYLEGTKQLIRSAFHIVNNTVSFSIYDYNTATGLVIDPSIIWGTYFGGPTADGLSTIDVDSAGNIYSAGYSLSNNLPMNGHQTIRGGNDDGLIVKLNKNYQLIWATYYGGTGWEEINGAELDALANLYIAGGTGSTSAIASSAAFQTTFGGPSYTNTVQDGFLVKFNSQGIRKWATYYGGTGTDRFLDITLDKFCNLVIVGSTTSTSGIAYNGFNNTGTGNDESFIVRFDSTGSRLLGTYYAQGLSKIGLDTTGNIIVAGSTYKTGLAFNGHQYVCYGTSSSNPTGFVAKLSPNLSSVIWATYYGGGNYDQIRCLAVDRQNNIYFGGLTKSDSLIAQNGFQNTKVGSSSYAEAFLVKFTEAGVRKWGTYLGANLNSHLNCIKVTKGSGDIYCGGGTNATTGVATSGAIVGNRLNNNTASLLDIFWEIIDSNCTKQYGTYMGGENSDVIYDMLPLNGALYLAGETMSTVGIASAGALQTTLLGARSGYLMKLLLNSGVLAGTIPLPQHKFCHNDVIHVPYKITGTYNAGNTFSLQLSAPGGSFSSSFTLVNKSNYPFTGWDTLNAPLLSSISAGGGYRIRFLSSSPADTILLPDTIRIFANPVSTISTANNPPFCENNHIQLQAANATSGHYKWYLNNVLQKDTDKVCTATSAGLYRVELTDSNGCSALSSVIVVYPNPITRIDMNDSSACLSGNQFTYTDSSIIGSGLLTRLWTIDGNSFSSPSVTKKYNSSGAYTVKLVTFSDKGCTDSLTKTTYVFPQPQSRLTINDTDQCLNGNMFAFADSSTISSGSIISRLWMFGSNDSSTIAFVTKQFPSAGNYFVRLVSYSDKNCTDTSNTLVRVYPNTSPLFTINNPTQCFRMNKFMLSDNTSFSQGTYNRLWSLGDQTTDTAKYLIKQYASEGTYSIKLNTITDKGCSDSIKKSISVNPHPTSFFNINDSVQCSNQNLFVFKNLSSISGGSTLHYFWQLGDNTTDSNLHVTKNYSSASNYTILLMTFSDKGCSDIFIKGITVKQAPVKPQIKVNGTVLSGNPASSYQWIKDSQDIAGANSQSLTITLNGVYKLRTDSSNGCSSTSDSVWVNWMGLEKPDIEWIRIYPNPFGAKLYISLLYSMELSIFDITGKPVLTQSIHFGNNEIDTHNLPANTYILRLKNQDRVLHGKLVKQ